MELQGIADEKCRCFLERAEQSEKQLTQRTAELEALQAEKLMLERGVSAQSALIDDLQSQLIQRTAALEAVQHERDEANSHVKFLGATKQANGSFCLDMKKYHARYRCGRHRDDPWKGIDTEIDCFVCLKHDLDAERELSAAWAEKAREYELELYGDPQNFHGRGRTIGVREHLSQLQALVRALPVVRIDLNGACHDTLLAQPEDDAVKELLRYRATLDATTPAPDTSIIGKCEPPSQWDPNAQVRGDIS